MQTIGGGENSAQMAAALSGMLRSIIEDYESKMSRLEDGADDYEEPSLEDGDIEVINETYRHIRDMLPINLHGHPACPNVPSLAPVPTKRANPPDDFSQCAVCADVVSSENCRLKLQS